MSYPNAMPIEIDPLRVEVLLIFAEAQHLGREPRAKHRHQGLGFNRRTPGAPRLHATPEDGARAREARRRERGAAGLPLLRGAAHPCGAHRGSPAKRYEPDEEVGPWTIVRWLGKGDNGAHMYEARCRCGTARVKQASAIRRDVNGCRDCAQRRARRLR